MAHSAAQRDFYAPETPAETPAASLNDITSLPYLCSWRTKDSAGVSEAFRSALDNQLQLEEGLRQLKQLTDSAPDSSTPQSSHIVQTLESSSNGLRQFISSIAHPVFFNERINSNGEQRMAQKVFEIPELLERILLSIDMQDIINMRQQSKIIHANIKGSPKLQRRLFLLPDTSSVLQIPKILDGGAHFAVGVVTIPLYSIPSNPGWYV